MAENKSKFKNEHYYVIKGWMINELDLRDTELLVYAIIYGLSQGENQYFTGSLQYLADATRRTKRSIISALEALVKKELLIKKEEFINGVKSCKYQCANYNGSEIISPDAVKKFHQGSEIISPEVVKNFHQGSEIISSDTLYKNKENIKDEEKEETAPPAPSEERIPYNEILEAYHTLCPSLPKVQKLSNDRKKAVRARIHDGFTVEQMKQAFINAEASPFLTGKVTGKDGRTFKANFDWIMTDKYFVKVLEDKYADMKPAQQKPEPEKQTPAFNPYADTEWDGEW